MKTHRTLTILVAVIIAASAVSTTAGIFSEGGPGPYQYRSIRGEVVDIYGRGIYRHMSAGVAVQGIAQDYITLFVGIPLLLAGLAGASRGSVRGRFLLAGTLGYFLVTYLFYTAMSMYNALFLVYVLLLAASFFALAAVLFSFRMDEVSGLFTEKAPAKAVGGFLIFNAVSIALLWLGIIVPPLLDGTVYPPQLEHYTTLIVQGLDLGLLLPLGFIAGWLLVRRKPPGYLAGTVYIVFLAILMTALTAKIIAMAMAGANVIPVVFIIPAFNLAAIGGAGWMLKEVKSFPVTDT